MNTSVVDERAPLLLVDDEPASGAPARVGNVKVFKSLAKDSVPGKVILDLVNTLIDL